MKTYKVIDQLELKDGKLMCKKPSRKSWQKAHYKQGDLDGACGAYSVAMALNILGVFEAEDIYSDSDSADNRFADRRMIKALNEFGLFRDGLTSEQITEVLTKHFSKMVRNLFGMTFTKYLNIIKISGALQMLKQGNMSISEIADSCGFNTIRNFNRVFKAFTGYSPTDIPIDYNYLYSLHIGYGLDPTLNCTVILNE